MRLRVLHVLRREARLCASAACMLRAAPSPSSGRGDVVRVGRRVRSPPARPTAARPRARHGPGRSTRPAPSPIKSRRAAHRTGARPARACSLNAVAQCLGRCKAAQAHRSMAARCRRTRPHPVSPLPDQARGAPIACTLAAHAVTSAPSGPEPVADRHLPRRQG